MLKTNELPEIIYQDYYFIVVAKPHQQLSVPAKSDHLGISIYEVILAKWPEARCVHRLDYETSGLMVFARGKKAERSLFASFRNRQVSKEYQAICWSPPEIESGTINLPLGKSGDGIREAVIDKGKHSLTDWSMTEHRGKYWLACLKPVTGRRHQLRVHLAALGCPMVNDPLYSAVGKAPISGRMYLHATRLSFPHPNSGNVVSFSSNSNFSSLLSELDSEENAKCS